MLAGRGWLVTTAGCVGMTVSTVAWPVTTPLESVSVRRCVLGLSGSGTVVVERVICAELRAARARVRKAVEYCIVRVVLGFWVCLKKS